MQQPIAAWIRNATERNVAAIQTNAVMGAPTDAEMLSSLWDDIATLKAIDVRVETAAAAVAMAETTAAVTASGRDHQRDTSARGVAMHKTKAKTHADRKKPNVI